MNPHPLEILRETPLFVAVVKPAGLPTTAPDRFPSVESRLRDQLQGADYLNAVHRLDRDVAGVVLLAKTKKSARLLSQQFESRKVNKTYLAWVHGIVSGLPCRWSDYVCKVEGEARGRVCEPDDVGAKFAETEVELVRDDKTRNRSLLRLSPKTGRMHQLRLQASHRGHPITGDPTYGEACPSDSMIASMIALFAAEIEFHDPKTGVLVKVAVPNPEAFVERAGPQERK